MKKVLSLIVTACMLMMLFVPLSASAQAYSASILVSEDSFTEENDPDSPVGSLNASLITTSSVEGAKPAAANRNVYLKYDLRSYDLSGLTSAKIRLHINTVSNKADRTITVYPVASDWTEAALTWNTAPLPTEDAVTTYLQKYVKNANKDIWITIDVTNYIKAHHNEGVVSFMLSTDTGATKIDSRETLYSPSLEVSFTSDKNTGNVIVKYLNEQNLPIARSVTMPKIQEGEYIYPHDIPPVVNYQGTAYAYNKTKSITQINITPDSDNEIILYYDDPMVTPEGVYKTIVPVCDDTFAKQTDANAVYNSEEPDVLEVTMNLGASGAAARRDGFVKFDAEDIPYTFITSARLTGYVTSATNPGERILKVYPTETLSWNEETLTWNNAPSYNGDPIAEFTIQSGTTGAWVSVDITQYCRNNPGPFSFRMIADTAATTFATKEGDTFNAMALDLRYTTDENYTLSTVVVKRVDTEGNEIEESEVLTDCLTGDYYYMGTPEKIINNDSGVFVYDKSLSTLHINVTEDGANEIILVYHKEGENMGTSVLAEEGGWNWCLDPRAIRDIDPDTGSDKTYVSYIDNRGNIKITVYDNNEDTYKQVFVREGFAADDHNNPSLLILPDHRVMVIYSQHTEEECFYYRISENPNDVSSFGEEKVVSTEGFGTVTYPTPFYMSDTPDAFYLFWRGTAWHPTMARFTLPDANDDISYEIEPVMYIDARENESVTNRRPYAKYTSNGKDKIYVSYTYAHPDTMETNTLYCSYIDINSLTLHSLTGEVLTDITSNPFKITNAETNPAIVVNRTDAIRNWNWEIELTEDEKPVVLYVGISKNGKSHLYYHAEWTGEDWTITYIDDGGQWFHDNTKGAEKCYSGGLCVDHNNTDIVYASIPVEGIYGEFYEIYRYVIENGEVISKTAVTKNSPENNFRPYVVKNSLPSDKVHLVWLSGEYYYWANKKDFLPSNGAVKYGYTNRVNTWSTLTGYDPTSDFESIDLKNTENVVTDLAFVEKSVNGARVTWESDNTDVISKTGVLTRPDEMCTVKVTATLSFSGQNFTKDYFLTVYPKDSINENLVFHYDFSDEDVYELDGQKMIKDKSPNGNDARFMGTSGKVADGLLDLSANGIKNDRVLDTNSYLIAPDGILNTLRSYTFIGKVKLSDTSADYRLYDFGSGGTNSIMGRLSQNLSAGVKLNGGTTQMVTADEKLSEGVWHTVAYTYDAKTHATSIYLDGKLVQSGKTIETEAIELLGKNTRNYIGRTQWWDTHYDYTSRENPDLKGMLDYIALYNTALSGEEISRLTNPTSSIDSVEISANTINVRITNNTAFPESYFIIASYDSENSFVVKTTPCPSLDPGESDTVPIEFPSPVTKDGLKVFIWNTKTNLKPLGVAYKG
ncbi:MAG: BNR-4 repeat-containing protein [Clostridia bacterium]|nr:BNR-4 repeat-containing protein [Clostridia bacterium]